MKRNIRKRHKIRPKESIFKKRSFWLVFLFLFLITFVVYFFVFFKPLQVNKIIISGNEKIMTGELEAIVFEKIRKNIWFFTSQNIFLISPAEINKSIMGRYPIVDSLEIKKIFPDTLLVGVKERRPFAVFYSEMNYYFIDEKGIIFEKALVDKASASAFLIMRQTKEEVDAVLGAEVIKKETMEKIAKIKKELDERSQIFVKEADIISEERLNVKTDESWEVYFNLIADINLQIEKLILLLKEELPKESRGGLEYIDLRFRDRAYYK